MVTFDATVKNNGTADAAPSGGFTTRFQIDLDSPTFAAPSLTLNPHPAITILAAGASQGVKSGDFSAVAGTHTILVCADLPISKVVETNELNNCTRWTFTVAAGPPPPPPPPPPPKPDLIINIGSSTPGGSQLVAGNTIMFQVTAKNIGDEVASSTFYNRFRLDLNASTFSGTGDVNLPPDPTVSSLDIGFSQLIDSGPWTAQAGTHVLRACADQAAVPANSNLIDEKSEFNNCSDWKFSVAASASFLAPHSFSALPAPVFSRTSQDRAFVPLFSAIRRDFFSGFSELVSDNSLLMTTVQNLSAIIKNTKIAEATSHMGDFTGWVSLSGIAADGTT